MKKHLSILFIFFSLFSAAQTPGEWTWMKGDTIPNSAGNYGIQGVPNSSNQPPSSYEPGVWTDLNGNFWMLGGYDNSVGGSGDLWMYDPLTNEWTWMFGTHTTEPPANYGTKGVPASTNSPGARYAGFLTWTDTSNNLWLFGGLVTLTPNAARNDLWKYDIASNLWTWMSGDSTKNSFGNYGVQGIPSVNNCPPSRRETTSAWIDNSNNLWLFGGTGGPSTNDRYDDVWKYDISTNEWTWMGGSNLNGRFPDYGIKGVGAVTNTPGARYTYSHWKDLSGNLWLFGGARLDTIQGHCVYNDMWKYNLSTNEWVWMSGASTINDLGYFGLPCTHDSLNLPCSRAENKACWTDSCGKFWMFGGTNWLNWSLATNDLWTYDPITNYWTFVNGTNQQSAGSFGSLGVSSPANIPRSVYGGCAWIRNDGSLWMCFGNSASSKSNTLWRFFPDTACTGYGSCSILPSVIFSSSNNLCPGTCTSFFNLSTNATSFQWSFPGGNPSNSTDVNPQNICYPSPGMYDVQLIATNANGSDTLLLTNYITVYPSPLPQSITQSGDTLFALPGAAMYQWYYNGNIVNGATDYFYIAPSGGDYNVVATDGNGCEVEAAIFNVVASIQSEVDDRQLTIFPNPVMDKLIIQKLQVTRGTTIEISVYNMIGELVFAVTPLSFGEGLGGEADVSHLPPGMYYLEVTAGSATFRTKLIKQ